MSEARQTIARKNEWFYGRQTSDRTPNFAPLASFAVNDPNPVWDWLLTPDNLKAAAHILVFEANQLTSNPPRSLRFHGHSNQKRKPIY